MWRDDRGFVYYDFNKPEELREDLLKSFDMVVVDPPFITEEVWRKYAATCKLLLKEGIDETTGQSFGKVILTTIYENKNLLNELLNAEPTVSILLSSPFFVRLPSYFTLLYRLSSLQSLIWYTSIISIPIILLFVSSEKTKKFLNKFLLLFLEE